MSFESIITADQEQHERLLSQRDFRRFFQRLGQLLRQYGSRSQEKERVLHYIYKMIKRRFKVDPEMLGYIIPPQFVLEEIITVDFSRLRVEYDRISTEVRKQFRFDSFLYGSARVGSRCIASDMDLVVCCEESRLGEIKKFLEKLDFWKTKVHRFNPIEGITGGNLKVDISSSSWLGGTTMSEFIIQSNELLSEISGVRSILLKLITLSKAIFMSYGFTYRGDNPYLPKLTGSIISTVSLMSLIQLVTSRSFRRQRNLSCLSNLFRALKDYDFERHVFHILLPNRIKVKALLPRPNYPNSSSTISEQLEANLVNFRRNVYIEWIFENMLFFRKINENILPDPKKFSSLKLQGKKPVIIVDPLNLKNNMGVSVTLEFMKNIQIFATRMLEDSNTLENMERFFFNRFKYFTFDDEAFKSFSLKQRIKWYEYVINLLEKKSSGGDDGDEEDEGEIIMSSEVTNIVNRLKKEMEGLKENVLFFFCD